MRDTEWLDDMNQYISRGLSNMDIETQNQIENIGKKFISNRLDDSELTWQQAALRFGEELATVGPNGYYSFTPKQWLDHALEQWKKLTVGITLLKPFHDVKKDWEEQQNEQVCAQSAENEKSGHQRLFDDTKKAESFTSSNCSPPDSSNEISIKGDGFYETVAQQDGSILVRQKWISINNFFPEPYIYVLVFSDNKGTNEPKPISLARWNKEKWEFINHIPVMPNYGAWQDIEYNMDTEDITHWMPLPSIDSFDDTKKAESFTSSNCDTNTEQDMSGECEKCHEHCLDCKCNKTA